MPCEIHPLFLKELQVVRRRVILVHQFAALEHAIRKGFVVTTSDHEYTWLLNANLDHLKVVWKVSFEVYKLVDAVFVLHVVNRNCPRIFLENIQLRGELHR